jgi:stage II sporulation protein D
MMRLGCLLLLLPMVLIGCANEPAAGPEVAAEVPIVRVRLAADVQQVSVGGGELVAQTEAQRNVLPDVGALPIRRAQGGWQIGTASFRGDDLTLLPRGEGVTITVDGDAYHGAIRLVPDDERAAVFDVVNVVDIELYLRGVLPPEVGGLGEPEAFKAQAVAARTYALYQARTRDFGHFDLAPDTGDQVYSGAGVEREATNAAVEATRGVVLAWGERGEEKIFKAYFHSSAGGATGSVADVYGEPAIPPLSAQELGDFGDEADFWTWPPVTLSRRDATRRLRAWGERRGHAVAGVGQVQNLEITRRGPGGRPAAFRVIDENRREFDLLPEELRPALNGGDFVLRSTFFDVVPTGDGFVFQNGRGWGHGVGMSQWAAAGMAAEGMDWRQILQRSYPRALLVRAY